MKTLQNNFTTPEQSKKLLELGVPADSADMCYEQCCESVVWVGEVGDVPQGKTFYMHEPALRHINPEGTWTWKDGERIDLSGKVDELRKTDIPCWSVGRLIEIYHICYKPGCSFSFHVCFPNLISEMIYKIVEAKERGWIDFSKLEV